MSSILFLLFPTIFLCYFNICVEGENIYPDINPYIPIKYSEDNSRTVIHTDSSSLEQTL